MNAKLLDIPTADGLCDSYVAYPENGGDTSSLPLVLFYMDAIGLRPQIYAMVEKIAEKGYFVIAPNLFYRARRVPLFDYTKLQAPGGLGELFKEIMPMMAQCTAEQVRRDTESLFDFAKAQARADISRTVTVGYCLGGALAIRSAANFPDHIRAAASFHAGRLVTDELSSPHLLAGQIKAQIYVAHADQDSNMTPAQIKVFEQALDAGGVRYTSELYKGAMHGFTMNDLPAYNEAADGRHWLNLLALFSGAAKVM